MKNLRKYAMLGLAFSIITASCTIQKRSYMKGYHIEWKNGNSKTTSDIGKVDNQELNQPEVEETNDLKLQKIETISLDNSIVKSEQKPNTHISVKHSSKDKNTVLSATSVDRNNSSNQLEIEPIVESNKINKNRNRKLNIEPLLKTGTTSTSLDNDLLILIIIALFIPPLAIGLFEELSNRFWISLVLFLLTVGAFAGLGLGLGGLVALLNIIWAILIVTGIL